MMNRMRERLAAVVTGAAFASAFVFSALSAVSGTPISPASSAATILANVVHRNRGLTYQSAISMHFREKSFPFLGATLSGTAYFNKNRDHFVVVFTKVPKLLSQFPAAYEQMMTIGDWPQRFVMTTQAPMEINGHSDDTLHLTARDPSSALQYAQVYVDPATWTIDQMNWHLKGMQFNVSQTFQTVGRMRVLASQTVDIHVPIAHAGASATFQDFHTTIPVAGAKTAP